VLSPIYSILLPQPIIVLFNKVAVDNPLSFVTLSVNISEIV
jgi:hypothetical protein